MYTDYVQSSSVHVLSLRLNCIKGSSCHFLFRLHEWGSCDTTGTGCHMSTLTSLVTFSSVWSDRVRIIITGVGVSQLVYRPDRNPRNWVVRSVIEILFHDNTRSKTSTLRLSLSSPWRRVSVYQSTMISTLNLGPQTKVLDSRIVVQCTGNIPE